MNTVKEIAQRVTAIKAPTTLSVKLGPDTIKVAVNYLEVGSRLSIQVASKGTLAKSCYPYPIGAQCET